MAENGNLHLKEDEWSNILMYRINVQRTRQKQIPTFNLSSTLTKSCMPNISVANKQILRPENIFARASTYVYYASLSLE